MTRDFVKEDAVARAVRWAEMLPADATAEDKDRAEAILHIHRAYEGRIGSLYRRIDDLEMRLGLSRR